MEKEIWTTERNIDDDFASGCAWYIDTFKATSARNISACIEKKEVDRWAVVGLAHDLYEANEKAKKLRTILCEMHGAKPRKGPSFIG